MERPKLKNYWLSWNHDYQKYTEFELYSPWWESDISNDGHTATIVAAIQAESPEHAQSAVYLAYNKKSKKKGSGQKYPKKLKWQFCNEREYTWEPFCARFPRSDWMIWTPLKENSPIPFPFPVSAEAMLDKIYHALPNYTHYNWPKADLAEKVSNTIKQLEILFRNELLEHTDTRTMSNGFASFLCQKLGKDFGEMYWEYCKTPEYKELTKRLMDLKNH